MTAEHPRSIAFIDLAKQQARIRQGLDAAIARVLDHGQYIMGPEVHQLEHELAVFCGAGHVITCANGTDALALALMAKGVKPGQAVIVPSFTFCATAEAVCLLGAVPVFSDIVRDTYNLDAESVKAAVMLARGLGLELRGVICVDLFGQPCNYDLLEPVVREEDLFLICDAAQAFGAAYRGRKVGTIGDITTTSFFPAKPLGCYGDGGAIFTEDDETASIVASLRIHGQGEDKYHNVRVGMNSRLDTLQAAILLQKLSTFSEEIELRNIVAEQYTATIPTALDSPRVVSGATSVWAQYSVCHPRRADILKAMKRCAVSTAIYYSVPLHQQPAYAHYPVAAGHLPNTESRAAEIFCLPMHPWLAPEEQQQVIAALAQAC